MRRLEQELRREGFRLIAGADEAGAGPLAGPLVAAAVILPADACLPTVDDSKRLTSQQREEGAAAVEAVAIAWAVVEIAAAEVDQIGPYQASLTGMSRALGRLDPAPDYVLTDARRLPGLAVPQQALIGGDGRCLAIAAASVLAKVHRDRLMVELDARFPGYGFAIHKGYGTARHLAALTELGPCPEHRKSYAPVRALIEPIPRLF